MEIQMFTLCDYATNESGKLTVVNTLDDIYAERFPWRAYFGFALKGIIKTIPEKEAKMELRIFKDGDSGNPLFEVNPSIPEKPGRFAAAANLRGLIFEAPGKYHFTVSVGDDVRRDYPFEVKELKKD